MSNKLRFRLTQLTIFLGVIGATVLFFSFQATSSTRSIVTDAHGNTWPCEGNHFLMTAGGLDAAPPSSAPLNPDHTYGCPSGSRRSLAEVTLEAPTWMPYLGFILIVGSSLAQIGLVRPETEEQAR